MPSAKAAFSPLDEELELGPETFDPWLVESIVLLGTVAPFERWLAFPDGKFAALHAAAPLVAGLPSGQVARQVARVACQLGLSFAEVTDAVTGALRAQE